MYLLAKDDTATAGLTAKCVADSCPCEPTAPPSLLPQQSRRTIRPSATPHDHMSCRYLPLRSHCTTFSVAAFTSSSLCVCISAQWRGVSIVCIVLYCIVPYYFVYWVLLCVYVCVCVCVRVSIPARSRGGLVLYCVVLYCIVLFCVLSIVVCVYLFMCVCACVSARGEEAFVLYCIALCCVAPY